ncbi:MAG TPA: proteasome accessory factor PafA2 family protein [Trebonia sp.]|nr:proteasome accessory factor PafA2 family protein [Trebonia sp.]
MTSRARRDSGGCAWSSATQPRARPPRCLKPDQRGADAVSRRVLGLWERALDAIGTGNLDAIAREIDWVIKYRLIERYRAEHDVPMSAPEVAQADLAYHDINRDRGLYYELQRGGAVERTARDVDIFEAKTVPPAPGRYRQAG